MNENQEMDAVQVEEAAPRYSEHPVESLKQAHKRTKEYLARAEQTNKAAHAYMRLMDNPDFNLVIGHLRTTLTQLGLELDTVNPDAQNMNLHTIRSISKVLHLLEGMPQLVSMTSANIAEAKQTLVDIERLI